MSQYRLNLFIQPEHAKRLDELAAKKGVSKSSIVAAALASWLSPDAGDQREAAIAKRLDRLSRQTERMERDQNIQIETLALFIRYFLTVSTPVPEAHRTRPAPRAKRASSSSSSSWVATCCVAAVWCATWWRNCTPIRCGWMTQQRWRPPMSELQSVRHECRSADSA
jgi:hypothetical protein